MLPIERVSQPPHGGAVLLDPVRFRGHIDGKAVGLFTLRNQRGMVVGITNYGAKIEQIVVPDHRGIFDDVLLGYDSLEAVMGGAPSMGAFVGRYAGRIGNARFSLNGDEYRLGANNGVHCLHGGLKGSRFRVFDAVQTDASSVRMSYVFGDGEEGFPGNLALSLSYTVTEADELVLDYEARAYGKATIASFTTHAFFNLEGELSGDLSRHVVTIHADHCLAMTPDLVATGEVVKLNGGALDLRQPAVLGERLGGPSATATAEAATSTRRIDGYDDCYVVRQAEAGALSLCARIFSPASGRAMEVWSTEPTLQFYTGKQPEEKLLGGTGKGGKAYFQQNGFCMEPQAYPNAPNCPAFPSAVIQPGQSRSGKTVYRFRVNRP